VVCFPLPALSEQQQHAAETPPCSWCAGWDLNEVYVHLHLLCCTFSVKLRGSHGPKYMHICSTDGLGWMGVQLWRSEWQHSIHWGSTPPKQAFTRDPEGPRQVTPKLSCSPLQASLSLSLGHTALLQAEKGLHMELSRCHYPLLLPSTADCMRQVQHFDHKTSTTTVVYFSLPLKQLTTPGKSSVLFGCGLLFLVLSKVQQKATLLPGLLQFTYF